MSVSPRALVAWAVGFASARILGYFENSYPSTFEFIQLRQELQTTRTAIEDFTSCESSLQTEIRYSSRLDAQFNSLLFVELCLVLGYLLIEFGRYFRVPRGSQAVLTQPIVDSSESVSVTSPSSSGTPTRSGPIRPSDLRR